MSLQSATFALKAAEQAVQCRPVDHAVTDDQRAVAGARGEEGQLPVEGHCPHRGLVVPATRCNVTVNRRNFVCITFQTSGRAWSSGPDRTSPADNRSCQ